MHRTLILIAVLWLSFPVAARDIVDISSFLDFGNPWEQSASVFMRSVNQPGAARSFDWVGQDSRDVARYPSRPDSPPVSLWNMRVWESLASFENGKLTQVKVSLYNKGDVGARGGTDALIKGEKEMWALLKKVDAAVSKWSRAKGKEERDRSLGANDVTIRRRHYVKDDKHLVTLVWSHSGRSKQDSVLEYATLIFVPLTRDNDPRIARATTSTSKAAMAKAAARPTEKGLRERVQKTPAGDVFIDGVPMVDQGAKGYCAVATMERVLRHYGSDVDQHLIAQLAQSSGRKGTSVAALTEALDKAGPKLGVRVKQLNGMEPDIDEWKALAKNYNRQAKRQRKPEIEDGQWIRQQGGVLQYSFVALMESMDWDVYKTYRVTKEKNDFTRFKLDIHKYIDSGVPLAWSVMLGRVKEAGLMQPRGGHMRLIIGYNDKSDELIYTDSWGPRHEFKKMDISDAWSITLMLHSISPRLRK